MNSSRKKKAFALRLQGKSYNEIRKTLNIPSKGTLSYWFKNLRLPPQAKKRLAKKMKLAQERGLLDFNQRRIKMIETENKRVYKKALRDIGDLTQRELLLIGAALYWGEGTKSGGKQKMWGIALSNSDPEVIACFMKFTREVLRVENQQIRAGIQLHPHISPEKAKKFWAKITKLPADRFYITKQISRAGKFKRAKRFLPFGTCTIKVNKRLLFHQIRGYIQGISNQLV